MCLPLQPMTVLQLWLPSVISVRYTKGQLKAYEMNLLSVLRSWGQQS